MISSPIDEVIKRRRSVRLYSDEPVSLKAVHSIISAGMYAPTACNVQGYRFIYIDDAELLAALVKAGTAYFMDKCKQAVMVLYESETNNLEYQDSTLSAGAVIENMLLKAEDIGVAACWVANMPVKSKVRRMFHIPKEYTPVSIVALGMPAKPAATLKRKNTLEAVLSHNFYSDHPDATNTVKPKSRVKLFVRKLAQRIYIRLPKTRFFRSIADQIENHFEN